MPQPNKIPLAFAASGDKNAIPESTETTGLASWREGFPAITSAPFSEGGIAPKRADFNGIFNALSQAVMWLQQGGVYAYDVNTDYEAGNVVLDAGGLYVANAGNGPSSTVVQPSSDTTGATWKLVRLDLATQIAAGYMSAADKTKLDGLISTLATPTAAGYMSAEDKAALDGVPTTYLPLSGGIIANASGSIQILPGKIEIYANMPYIDFHHMNSLLDNTGRIINDADGQLTINIKNDATTQSKDLVLFSNGALQWGGKNIAVVDSVDTTVQGYVRLTNGLQILWGSGNVPVDDVQTGEVITFEKPFSVPPCIFTTVAFGGGPFGYGYGVQFYNRSATGCTFIIGTSSGGTTPRYTNGAYNFLAIGPWA